LTPAGSSQSSLDRAESDRPSFLADLVAVSGARASDDAMRGALMPGEREYDGARPADRSIAGALSREQIAQKSPVDAA